MSGQTPPRRDHRLPTDAGRKVMTVPLMHLFALFLAMPAFAHAADAGQPDIKLNPAPKMRYEITATVNRKDFQDDADKTFVIELVAREKTP